MSNAKFRIEGLEKIWLIDMGEEIVWCDSPTPAPEMEYEDSTAYVRADVLAAKQAKIDELMLEYCPNEMTPEQIKNWEAHQVKSDVQL